MTSINATNLTRPGMGAIEGTDFEDVDEELDAVEVNDFTNSSRRPFTTSELGLGKTAKCFPWRTKIIVGIWTTPQWATASYSKSKIISTKEINVIHIILEL